MSEKGIPKEVFEKDPRIKEVKPKKEPEKTQEPVNIETEAGESGTEGKDEAGFSKEPLVAARTTEDLENERVEQKLEGAMVVEVEETLERITSLPTIEEAREELRTVRPPRYFEFEEESGGLVRKESIYEPQSYALPSFEEVVEEKSKSLSPYIWLVVVLILSALAFLVYRLVS